ncbi:unnamed protein product, partial [Symbiodinium sp. KB8]
HRLLQGVRTSMAPWSPAIGASPRLCTWDSACRRELLPGAAPEILFPRCRHLGCRGAGDPCTALDQIQPHQPLPLPAGGDIQVCRQSRGTGSPKSNSKTLALSLRSGSRSLASSGLLRFPGALPSSRRPLPRSRVPLGLHHAKSCRAPVARHQRTTQVPSCWRLGAGPGA